MEFFISLCYIFSQAKSDSNSQEEKEKKSVNFSRKCFEYFLLKALKAFFPFLQKKNNICHQEKGKKINIHIRYKYEVSKRLLIHMNFIIPTCAHLIHEN